MIYCGSCSSYDFGKVSVPVLAPGVPAPVPVPDPEHSVSTTKLCTKSFLFNVRSSIIFQKDGLSFFILFFSLYFMLDPDSNPALEPDLDPEP
jgi:hypothetical protein